MPLCFYDFFRTLPGYTGLSGEMGTGPEGEPTCPELAFRVSFSRSTGVVFLDWCAERSVRTQTDASVRETVSREGRVVTRTYDTPLGTLRRVSEDWSEEYNAVYEREHLLKTPADARVYRYIVDATHTVKDFEHGKQWLTVMDGSGVCGHAGLCAPFHLLMQAYGPEEFLAMAADGLTGEVRALHDALRKQTLTRCAIMAESPFEVFDFESSWDVGVLSPTLYRQHYVPCMRECTDILHAAGKLCMDHASGQTVDRFLDGMLESGLDMLYGVTIGESNARGIVEMARRCEGRLLLCLGLCPMRLWDSSEAEVRARCGKIMAATAGVPVLFGTADAVVAGTEPGRLQRVRALLCGDGKE
jgi:hypothetical protein